MTTLHDLRASLAAHADALDDDGLATRAGAVQVRVRRLRRQRRAALAGGLAAVLVIAGLGAVLRPNAHRGAIQPAGVPATVAVDGFDYHFDHAETSRSGSHRLVVKLPKSTDRRAVMLVGTGLGSGTATLREYDQDVQRLMHDGTEPAFPIGSDADQFTLTLAGTPATAQVSLAVYSRTPGRPVYRRRIENRTLIGDDTDTNVSTLTYTFTSPGGEVGWATTCHAPGVARPKLRLSIDGKGYAEGACDDASIPEDAGSSAWASWHIPAGRHTATMTVVSGRTTAPADLPGAVLSLGAYTVDDRDVLGAPVPAVTEEYGRTYAADRTLFTGSTITPTEPILATMIGSSQGMARLAVTGGGEESGDGDSWDETDAGAGSRPWSVEQVLLPGETYQLHMHYGAKARHDGGILLFRPVTR